jgi:hypothetical protein
MIDPPVTISLRIPGTWSHPRDLVERLPEGYRLTPEALILPDETQVEFIALSADRQFAGIFRTQCRQPATEQELESVANYKVNACLSGPGGSSESAQAMMRAAAALVRAGGAGVFIDNSALAHGGQNWLAMAEDGGPDAISFAFVAIVDSPREAWTMGMHVLGLCDLVMKREDASSDEFGIIDVIRYMARGEKPVGDGHILCDLSGPRFRAYAAEGNADLPPDSPMHNPFGRLRIVSARDVVERN